MQNYETAVKAMQAGKYDRAQGLLEKVLEGPDKGLADRARVHMRACEQHLSQSSTNFRSPEEHFDYAAALMNNGDFEEARNHIARILRGHPKADYAHYGLAALHCLTGKVEEALRSLEESIRMNPANRFQARNDTDFQTMADDPRFTELIYPEPENASIVELPPATPGKRR